jgi:hypothetical protein
VKFARKWVENRKNGFMIASKSTKQGRFLVLYWVFFEENC